MPSRFFTLGNSARLFILFVAAAYGQQASSAPQVGYVRFWDMLPVANGKFELRKMNATPNEGSLLTGVAYRCASYTELPIGIYKLGIFKAGDHDNAVKVFDVNLQADHFFTILLSPRNGALNAELIEDTNDPKAGSGTLTVRNFFTGTNVSVSTDKQKIIDTLPYGENASASGFALARLALILKTKMPNGVMAESTTEADFSAAKHATVLIIPDSYGRFRPRTTIDGKNL